MKLSFGERLLDWRIRAGDGKKLPHMTVVAQTGISQGQLSKMENNHTGPAGLTAEQIVRLLKLYKVSLQEFFEALSESQQAEFLPRAKEVQKVLQGDALGDLVLSIQTGPTGSEYQSIAVYPLKGAENPDGHESLSFSIGVKPSQIKEGMLALQMQGDEMQTSRFNSVRDQDIFFVDTQTTDPKDNQIYVINQGGKIHLRRFRGGFWMADNPEHVPLPPGDVRVIGHAFLLYPNKPL